MAEESTKLICDIVTPVEKLFSEECYMAIVPGVDGEMGYLINHAPLMSTLADGVVRVLSDASTVSHRYALQGGYVQVTGEKVIVLADRAISVDDIESREVAEQATEAKQKLEALAEDDPNRSVAQADVRWFELLSNVSKA